MRSIAVQCRDKNDIRPLPPIPDTLIAGMRQLIDTKLNAEGATLFEQLAAVYSFLDRYSVFVSTFSVCQKGCAHCCRIDVDVSRLEAEYIAIKRNTAFDNGRKKTVGHNRACPFLTPDGACSIYDSRPFNCRTFHTLDDPKYCAIGDESHQVYGSSGAGYGAGMYAQLANWLRVIHNEHDLPYRDIRDWFPLRQP